MKKRVSIKDVALHVGVSTALVSYVLNNKKEGRISKEAAAKIRQAAIDLNYVPNQIARSLKSQKTNTIGLIVADIANPFSSQIARIIEDEAQKNGYSVIFGSSDESADKTQNLIFLLLNRQVDGFIVALPENAEKQLNYLAGIDIPFVLFDRYYPEVETNFVAIDNYKAASQAVQHLMANGRKQIGIVTYQTGLHHLSERKRGATDLIQNTSLEVNVRIDHLKEDVDAGIDRLLKLDTPVDALFFTTNLLAISGLKYLNELGVKVPEQIAVVGFDETDAFDLFYSPVTYVKQPMEQLASQSLRLLLDAIDNPGAKQGVVIDTELVVRKSSVS
ncbi:MAG: LacI family transcriptional regulator [Bacteroidales bacterium 45-6]|nr:MAG: LacI family transcriptional regulator [Bacteroidales bacterium 45-6]